MVDTSLFFIQSTARKISRRVTEAALTTTQLNQYINYFMLYKLPESLKLKDLRKVFEFYTTPNVDTYQTETSDPLNPFFDFKNKFTNVLQPIYFAGVQGSFYINRDQFYSYWPQTNLISNLNQSGDGVTTVYTGTASPVPMLPNSVSITSLDVMGNSIVLIDYPQPTTPLIGALGIVGQPQLLPSPYGQINYITGDYSLNFPTPPAAQAQIFIENFIYQPGLPTSMLLFDNIITIRPVPDKTYTVQMTVDALPTELLAEDQSPDIKQWAEYIALGTAMLIFRDNMDFNSINMLQPEFDKVEMLVQRPTICQAVESATFSYYKQRRRSYGWWPFGTWPY